MGATESRSRLSSSNEHPTQGYHVLRVADGSPAAQAGIESFFDFILGIDGVALDPSRDVDGRRSGDVAQQQDPRTPGVGDSAGMGAWKSLEEREGTTVVLNVWSSKRQELRGEYVAIVPSRHWTSPSTPTPTNTATQPSLLGLSLRLCDPSTSLLNVWHILEVLEGSPAESAGLVPFGDWVIGWAGGVMSGEGDFYEVVEAHLDRPLRLYVYNADYDHTREVIIVPNRNWGGDGLLGCGVGYGLLHRIPKPQEHVGRASLAADEAPAPEPKEYVQQGVLSVHMEDGGAMPTSGVPSASGGGGKASAGQAQDGMFRPADAYLPLPKQTVSVPVEEA